MASPLLGIAGINSLLFATYGMSQRLISPYPQLSLKETALAGSIAGAVNAVIASPGKFLLRLSGTTFKLRGLPVELFKIRMQGQYGAITDQRLRAVGRELLSEWGFRKGVMRGFWVGLYSYLVRI